MSFQDTSETTQFWAKSVAVNSKRTGLHRTLLGGIATSVAHSIYRWTSQYDHGRRKPGVIGMTRIASVSVIRNAAFIAIILAFTCKFTALIFKYSNTCAWWHVHPFPTGLSPAMVWKFWLRNALTSAKCVSFSSQVPCWWLGLGEAYPQTWLITLGTALSLWQESSWTWFCHTKIRLIIYAQKIHSIVSGF